MILLLSILLLSHHFFVLGQSNSCSAKDEYRRFVICNVGLWSTSFGFQAKHIDPYLCSHLSMSYLELNGDDFSIVMPGEDREVRWKLLREIVQLKRINPSLQLLVSIGGYVDLNNGNEQKYYKLESPRLMESFIANVIGLLRQEGLDGIDFVWNFLGRGKPVSSDVAQMAKISKSLCSNLQKYGYLCTITLVHASTYNANDTDSKVFFSDLKTIIRSADIIGIWTTDLSPHNGLFHMDMLHTPTPTGSPSAGTMALNTVESVVNFYTDHLSLSKDELRKIAILIPMQTVGLSNSGDTSLDMELGSGTDTISKDYGNFNQYSYKVICERLKNVVSHPDALSLKFYGGAPFAVSASGKNYFPLNTRDYVKEKVQFAVSRGLGGIIVFQIGADDFLGRCENIPLPLVSAISDEILKANCRHN